MPSQPAPLTVHPDRLLPVDPGVRNIARRLYDAVRDLPIVSPHGHVDPQMLVDDVPFRDPAHLFVTPDHYVTRLLHASGIALEDLGVGQGPLSEAAARTAWRLLCSHWEVFRGTPVRYWLESELVEIFDVTVRPSAATADALYDHIAERLAMDAYRPRALFDRFKISVLATTDTITLSYTFYPATPDGSAPQGSAEAAPSGSRRAIAAAVTPGGAKLQ